MVGTKSYHVVVLRRACGRSVRAAACAVRCRCAAACSRSCCCVQSVVLLPLPRAVGRSVRPCCSLCGVRSVRAAVPASCGLSLRAAASAVCGPFRLCRPHGLRRSAMSFSDVYTQEVGNNGRHKILPCCVVAPCVRSVGACCCLCGAQSVVLRGAVGRAAASRQLCCCVCLLQSVGRCVLQPVRCAVRVCCCAGRVRSVPSCRCVGRVRSVSAASAARTQTVVYVIFGRLYPGGGKQWSAQNPTMLWRCAACAGGRCVLPPVRCAVGCAPASAACSRSCCRVQLVVLLRLSRSVGRCVGLCFSFGAVCCTLKSRSYCPARVSARAQRPVAPASFRSLFFLPASPSGAGV